MNRGVERRSIFENAIDRRYFLSCLAREVHRGRLEIHAFTLMGNHFHLLVRSPVGRLSEGMGEAERSYVRYFNREQGRDGPLFRGRFLSLPIEDESYRWTVLRYIDANPVADGFASRARDYAWGSARYYFRGQGPPWLSMSWVRMEWERLYGRPLKLGQYGDEGSDSFARETAELLKARIVATKGEDPIGDAAVLNQAVVRDWLASRAAGPERFEPFVPLAHADVILRVCMIEHLRGWTVVLGRRSMEGATILGVGLLRDLRGLGLKEIAELRGMSTAGVTRNAQRHRRLMLSDPDYRAKATETAWEAVRTSLAIARS